MSNNFFPCCEINNNWAEKIVKDVLLNSLPNTYIVIYGKRLLYERNNRLTDGEVDFIIISPDAGILVIEVKGGGIIRDKEKFYSIDRNENRYEIKNPYEQALNNKNKIIDELKRKNIHINRNYYIGHAVFFPDINKDINFAGLEYRKEITLNANNLNNSFSKIQNIMKMWLGPNKITQPLSQKDLLKALLPSEIINLAMPNRIKMENEIIKKATDEQIEIILNAISNNKMIIKGCAGSGKTIIAQYLAKKFAEENKKVLFCCYNAQLKEYISTNLQHKNITILNFHELCRRIITKAGEKIPIFNGIDENNYYEKILPENAFYCLENFNEEKYDVVIIDEGQDFKNDWWAIIEELLNKEAKFYIFADDNQNIYGGVQYPKEGFFCYRLSKNCRNTKNVFNVSNNFYKGDPVSCLKEAEGFYRFYPLNMNVIEKISEIVNILLNNGISYRDITILSAFSENNSKLKGRIGRYNLIWDLNHNGIKCSSIYSFKGLENDIIILTEIENIPEKQRYELLYVATTRAKNSLYVVATKNLI